MITYTIKRKNGCAVKYSESPLKLSNGEIVPFKIEGILQPKGVNDEEMADFLKNVENKLDTEIVSRTQAQGVFPHFYIDCPYPDKADLLVKIFNMSYVEAFQYWVDKTHYEFEVGPYICPATRDLLGRDGLDGAHVEIVGYPEMGRFITPVQQGFNRSHSRMSFYVKPEYLVVAPGEEK